MTNCFLDRWRDVIASSQRKKVEVDAFHPLRFIAGVNDHDDPIIFVIVDEKPPVPDLSGIIEVERRQRPSDRKWTLALSLTDRRFLDPYLQFSVDLVTRTRDVANEAQGLATLLKVVADWKRMLARGSRAPLSESGLRGLIAELWFGATVLRREAEAPRVALAWKGPYGGHQDYAFDLGRRYEVKSRRPDAEVVTIASPEQLDADDLTLALVTLVDVESEIDGSVSLAKLVAGIRTELAGSPPAALAFDNALEELDVDPTDSRYADRWFVIAESVEYTVTDDFPAIRRRTVPDAVVAARYDISIKAIEGFVTGRWTPEATG